MSQLATKLLDIYSGPIQISVRLLTTLMRSIHELIWAILFLAALGHEPITACVALALPFTGTLAKVFSEIIDEQSVLARDHPHRVRSRAAASIPHFLDPSILSRHRYLHRLPF